MNKCVPPDWFLGYDQFAIYTFLNLVGNEDKSFNEKGYLKTFIRSKKNQINLLNNLNTFKVNYAKDFADLVSNDPND